MLPAVQPWSFQVRAILAALAALVVLSWVFVVREAGSLMPPAIGPMDSMGEMGAAQTLGGVVFVPVWTVMMIAMMFPTAAPMMTLYARTRPSGVSSMSHTAAFAFGYVLLWALFGAAAYGAAAGAQRALDMAGPVREFSRFAPAAALIAAGAYQWTPLKRVCLSHCQNPMTFLLHHWRTPGFVGSLRTGLEHGVYCIGCCWGEMVVLFVVGVMSVPWMAMLTLFIFLEKVTKPGIILARAAGVGAAAYGVVLLVSAIR